MLWARTAQLRADAPDALPDGEPRSRGEDADRPHERSPRCEHETDGDHDDAFRAAPDVAAQAERLRAGARVADEERPGDGGECEPDADEVVVAREDERDRPEDD